MAKIDPRLDILVLGDHPAAYLCAALLKYKTKLHVLHSTLPHENWPDRLLILNPSLFDLHPLLDPLRRKIETTPIYGLRFISDTVGVASEHRSRSAMAGITSYKTVRTAMLKLAQSQGVDLLTPKHVDIQRLDESGIDVTVGKSQLRPKMLILAGLPNEQESKRLGLPEGWGPEVVHRYTFLKLPGSKWADLGSRPIVPMSLNLKDLLCWAWLLPSEKCVQIAVEQPVETLSRVGPQELLSHWVAVLRAHELLNAKGEVPVEQAHSLDLPLAGALAHEGLANRTLLIGPAGGFYSATAEDVYPNCWSAIYAADAVKKALREVHLQDALQPYRHKWRTTLGDYLRGPQQNLRFLLPLVYRNPVMTSRLTESILLGKSVVR